MSEAPRSLIRFEVMGWLGLKPYGFGIASGSLAVQPFGWGWPSPANRPSSPQPSSRASAHPSSATGCRVAT